MIPVGKDFRPLGEYYLCQEKISTTREVAEFRGLFCISLKEASICSRSDSLHATGHKADGKLVGVLPARFGGLEQSREKTVQPH